VSEKSQETGGNDESTPGARTAVRHETVTAEDAGSRVDKVLSRLLPGMPHTRIFRLLRKGEVRLNGKRVSGEARVAEGDVLRVPPVAVEAPPPPDDAISSRASPRLVQQVQAAIIHEDERLLVVNKPAGIAVHGGSGVSAGVIEALRAARPEETLELVHRLDRDTSGCLLVARKRATLRSLHALLREDTAGEEGGFDKRYLVLVRGKWELGKKRIDAPLATHTRVGGERTVKVAPGGKQASSEFSVVQFFGNLATLLEVKLLTGRTHQIRVHAAYAGHPVAGDEKYGDIEFNRQLRPFGLHRLFLHAHSVSFEEPERRVTLSVSAPLPPELHAVIDALTARAGRLRPAGTTRAGVADPRFVSERPVAPARPAWRKPRPEGNPRREGRPGSAPKGRPRPAGGRPAPAGRKPGASRKGPRRSP